MRLNVILPWVVALFGHRNPSPAGASFGYLQTEPTIRVRCCGAVMSVLYGRTRQTLRFLPNLPLYRNFLFTARSFLQSRRSFIAANTPIQRGIDVRYDEGANSC